MSGNERRYYVFGRVRRAVPLLFLILFFAAPLVRADVTEKLIGVEAEEVWKSLLKTAEPYGIKKKDEGKKKLETGWKEDYVSRNRGLLKKVASQRYERRYRFKIQLKGEPLAANVEIKGVFQEREAGAPPQSPWRPVKPAAAEYEVEQEFFKKLISRLEIDKKI